MHGTMRAAVVEELGAPLRIRAVEVPRPGPGEMLVRLAACGVCHSDVHIWRGDVAAAQPPSPFVLGHEGIGEVFETGADVRGWKAGDRVGVPWLHATCGTCVACRSGSENFCAHQKAHGLDAPGAFAEFVVVRCDQAVAVPSGLDPFELAPLMCAGVTAYGAVERCGLSAGETVAIFGCGGLGLYAVQIARRKGLRIVAVDRDPARLDQAVALGADSTWDGDLSAGRPHAGRAHSCINFAPTTATWQAVLDTVRPLGRVVAAAMVSAPVPLNQEWLIASGVTITGTSLGTRAQMRELLAMHERAPFKGNIVHIGLEEAGTALHALHLGRAPGRYVVDITRTR